MTKLQNIGISILIIGLLFCTSCGNNTDDFETQKELELIDSLALQLAKTKTYLNIDYQEIKERVAPMEKNMEFLKNNFKGEWTEEVNMNLERYKGYIKMYKKFIIYYKKVVLETEVLYTQVKTLKKSVKNGKYKGKKEEFKKYYEQEKKDVHNNFLFAERYLKPVRIMEKDYQRRSDYVEELIKSLK